MPDGTTCTKGPSSHCVTRGEAIGLTSLVATATASGIAVLMACLLITRNVIRESRSRSGKRLIQQPMDIYMLSLLAADLFHTLGSLMNVKWIGEGKVQTGTYCSVQGAMNQIGPVAVAMNTLVIVFVTFITVWWGRGIPAGRSIKVQLATAAVIICVMWIAVILCVLIPYLIYGNPSDPYYAPTPLWCTIAKQYEFTRLFAKYLWLWVACVFSFILYIPLSLWSQGYITPTRWWFTIHKKKPIVDASEGRRRFYIATIAYPLSNAILIIPLSIVRWIQNAGRSDLITSSDSIAVVAIFDLSGLFNVLLFFLTRPTLLLFRRAHCSKCPREVEEESES